MPAGNDPAVSQVRAMRCNRGGMTNAAPRACFVAVRVRLPTAPAAASGRGGQPVELRPAAGR
ncbi:hypothetical protein WK25_28795 [Burkholderia latens]|nr:hypothetical protein WK25_28795 [Burkholderia latens]